MQLGRPSEKHLRQMQLQTLKAITQGEVMNNMSQEQVKELYTYNPESGVFERKGRYIGIRKDANNYLRAHYKGKSYSVQRLIWIYMTGNAPSGDIDHIDHDRSNNKWINLREVTRKQNMQNAKRSKASTSGFTGVTWCKQQSQWQAQIMIDGKCKKLGRFNSKIDAIAERIRANKHYDFHNNHGAVIA